ncbi:MAG: aldehyde dehydrogenase [Myxococcales bacterium]|nr:aldehyde dehydrogenase [Myxococcales bacterium]
MTPIRLGINGMGRIGRLALRHALARRDANATFARSGPPVEVVAANDLADADEIAYLLTHDSVHRWNLPRVQAEGDALRVNDSKLALFKEKDPSKIPWSAHGVDIVIEATGRFTTGETMAGHRVAKDGPSHVVLAAPGKGVDKTIVVGVNEDALDADKDRLISNASCTTNALTPVLATLDRAFGVRWGLVGTTHAYTNGQGIIDTLSGKDLRRGRAGAINIVPTSTGAAKAISQVLPGLTGKVDGTAVRVPVVDGSLYDVVCTLEGSPSKDRVIEALREASKSDGLKGILDVRDEALVSSDILGDSHSSIVDVEACMGLGQLVKIVGWYDNEWGYSARLLDLVAILGSAIRKKAS